MKITAEMKQLIASKVREKAEKRAAELNAQLMKLYKKAGEQGRKDLAAFIKSPEYKKLLAEAEKVNDRLESTGFRVTVPEIEVKNGRVVDSYGREVYNAGNVPEIRVYNAAKSDHPVGARTHCYNLSYTTGAFKAVNEAYLAAQAEVGGILDSYVAMVAEASMGSDYEELKKILEKHGIKL